MLVMSNDYSKSVKSMLIKMKERGIEFGKPIPFMESESGMSEEEIRKGLFNFDELEFTEKQDHDGETRYALYFVHNRRKGHRFVITFREKIRLITVFPLGRHTLAKYYKKKFKKI